MTFRGPIYSNRPPPYVKMGAIQRGNPSPWLQVEYEQSPVAEFQNFSEHPGYLPPAETVLYPNLALIVGVPSLVPIAMFQNFSERPSYLPPAETVLYPNLALEQTAPPTYSLLPQIWL